MHQQLKEFLWQCNVQKCYRDAKDMQCRSSYQSIINNIRKNIRNVDCHLYGSRIMGVALKDADLDVFIDIDGSLTAPLSRDSAVAYFDLIQNRLRKDSDIWIVKQAIFETRVPFIRATYKPFNMEVDVTFTTGLGVATTNIFRHLFDIQPAAAKFCILIKNWLNSNGLEFRSFTVVLLAVFYLQQRGFLPPITTVLNNAYPKEYMHGFEVQMDQRMGLNNYGIRHFEGLKQYKVVAGFFEFYKKFDYENSMMLPKSGTIAPKREGKEWMKSICIAGPIREDKNHAWDIGRKRFEKFVGLCVTTLYDLE